MQKLSYAPAQLLAGVVYELLAGQPPQSDYRPLSLIPENANQRLKNILAQESPDQTSASDLWLALKADFPEVPKAPTRTQKQEPKPAPSTGSTPPDPVKAPPKLQAFLTPAQPPQTIAFSPPQKSNWAWLWLVLASLFVLICAVALVSLLSSHSSVSQPSPSPTPEPAASQSPTPAPTLEPTVPLTPTGTPTPNPSSANAAFDFNSRGDIEYLDRRFDEAIADYSEAIRLNPDFILAYRNRALCYEAIGKTVEAKRDRAKADEKSLGAVTVAGPKRRE